MFLYPSLITALALVLFFVVTQRVGAARERYKVALPATTGHPDFERYYRVQMNTLEQLALFLPALWLFAAYVSPIWAGALGAIWLLGRIAFARGYYKATEKRVPGFIVAMLASSILLLGAIIAILREIAATL